MGRFGLRYLFCLGLIGLAACGSEGTLEGSLFGQSGLLSCDFINDNSSYAPFTTCGVYDSTNQTVCSCLHQSERTEFAFFTTPANRDHWLSIYPNVRPTYNGESTFDNTNPYHLMIQYSF
jgi:hypothetical protein